MHGGGLNCRLRRGAETISSTDLTRLRCKLLWPAHVPMWSSSAKREWELQAGIITYVSSAYWHTRFPAVMAVRSQESDYIGCGPNGRALDDTCRYFSESRSLVSELCTVRMSLKELHKPVVGVIWDCKICKLFKQGVVTNSIKCFGEVKCQYYDIIIIN